MKLVDRNNEELTVVSQVLVPNKLEMVYNIEVDGFHTYHVGRFGTWVHNANCCNVTRAKLEENYGKISDDFFGKNGQIYWKNPLNNKIEQLNDVKNINGIPSVKDPISGQWVDASKVHVATDHILPQKYFKSIQGFNELPKSVQSKLMNDMENLQPMLKSANSSKSNRVEFNNNFSFATWKKVPVSTAYRKFLLDTQAKISAKVVKAVNANQKK